MAKESDIEGSTLSSSYSDPIYDRLEGAKAALARRWPLYIGLAVLITVGWLVADWYRTRSPAAAAAQRLMVAQEEGLEALLPLVGDVGYLPGYRVRAALEVARLELAADHHAEALAILAQAEPDANELADPVLRAALLLSRAAIHEQAGDWEQAIASYGAAQRAGGQQAKAHTLAARLGEARSTLLQADATADAEQALSLRRSARQQLEDLTTITGEGSGSLVQLAMYQLALLELEHPEILDLEDPPPALDRAALLAKPAEEAAPAAEAAAPAAEEPAPEEVDAPAAEDATTGEQPAAEAPASE